MSTTHIDTNSQPRTDLGVQGEVAEILNEQLCGAKNVVGALRWLDKGDRFAASELADTHQLIYLMEGEGVISLNAKDYPVKKGAGVYLGPSETATIAHTGETPLKLFHLVVPKKQDDAG